jgi:hypothetical protein
LDLSKNQFLILLALLVQGGGAFQKDVKPEIKKPDRDALARAGLIVSEKRGRKGVWIEVADKGWAHAAENLGADLPKSQAAAAILQAFLARLGAFLRARDISLAEFLSPAAERPAEAGAAGPLAERIRAAYLDVTGGRLNTRALLRDIRARLPDVDREALDAELLAMYRAASAALMPEDDRRALTTADHEAALVIGGAPRHVLWLER